MAFLRPFCSCVLFLLLTSVTQVETQNTECSAGNTFVDIMENNNPGLVVTNIHADPGIIITIKPSTGDSSPSEWFEIKDSQLILKKSVDYETATLLQLELICWKADLQVKSIIVLISIHNENDNEPVFKQTNITVHVPEDTKVNATVVPLANVTATDADLNTVYYSLEGSPSEAMDYFNIQGINNPQIYLRKALDYEAINFMRFTLKAMDGSADEAGTHTATATISIQIVQSDFRPPWFQPCTAIGGRIECISLGYTSKVNLSEQVSGPLILEPGPLYAIDGDKSLNEKVIYEIVAGNDNDTFKINRYSGNITMTQPANTLKTFMLYIVASQENNAFRYSQTTVKIDVVRKNDHRPYFEELIYLGRISEAQPAKSLIMKANTSSEPLQIFAADDDFLPDKINPDIKYRIQNSSDFRATAEGFIQTTKILNASSHISLWAIATDISTLEEASTVISIDVTPLATPTPAVPPVTTTAFTETSPTSPGKGNTSQKPSTLPPGISSPKPSGSTKSMSPLSSTTGKDNLISTLPPGISSPKPSGSTKSMSPLSSTTGKDNLTEITRNPVTVSVSGSVIPPFVTTLKPPVIPGNPTQSLPTSSLVTERSQWTEESIKTSSPTTTQAPPQSGTPKPTPPSNFTTSSGSVQSSTSTTSSTTKSNYVSSTSLSSTTATSTLFVANTSATSHTSKSSISTSSTSTSTSMFSIKPSIENVTISSENESHNPGSPITAFTPKTEGNAAVLVAVMPSGSVIPPFVTTLKPPVIPGNSTQSLTSSPTITQVSPQSEAPKTLPGNSTRTSNPTITQVSSQSEAPKTLSESGNAGNMAVLGATLGTLLAIALALLALISYKYYKLKKETEKENSQLTESFSNADFQDDENSDGNNDESPPSLLSRSYAEKEPENKKTQSAHKTIQEEIDIHSEKEVRSILTKDRKTEDDGYKAVWFKEDVTEAKSDDVMIDEDSDLEQNRLGSAEEEDDHDDTNSGRGDSDVNMRVRRGQVFDTKPSASRSLDEAEEQDDTL